MPTNIALLSPSHSPDASNLSDAATARDAISVLTFSFVGLVTELLAILCSNGDGWATSLSSGLIAGAPLRIPIDVAQDSEMISPTIPI